MSSYQMWPHYLVHNATNLVSKLFKNSAFILFALLAATGSSYAQNTKQVSLQLLPVFNNSKLSLFEEIDMVIPEGATHITTLRFYLSGITLLQNNTPVWSELNSYHLVDAAIEQTLQLALQVPSKLQFDGVMFQLGIDSITNVSGAMGGDLDPSKGMYWSWQSGYINFKLEGTNTICPTRNHEFQFHLGGYAAPNSSLQTVQLTVPHSQRINILVNINKLLESIDLSKQNSIMIPGNEAVLLSKNAASIFSIRP